MKWKTEQGTEKIKDTTEWFFEKINNIDEHLDRLIRKKKKEDTD